MKLWQPSQQQQSRTERGDIDLKHRTKLDAVDLVIPQTIYLCLNSLQMGRKECIVVYGILGNITSYSVMTN